MNVTMQQHQENLASMGTLLDSTKDCAIRIAPDDKETQKLLDEQKAKIDEAFKVLIVGSYNCGKSSLINALAGREELLPTGNLPETGVITELIYGTEYRITLYPKKGSGLTKPVILRNPTPKQFKQECSIDNTVDPDNKNKTANLKYERVVVECDIPLLKEGIMLIDTVGMNDPWGNDYITESYLPKADAIIYLMSCDRIYTKDDKDLLTKINKHGFKDIIICYNKLGIVRNNNRRPNQQNAMQQFYDVARMHAANHTDIGDRGIHFIDSLDALDAKLYKDQQLYVSSGMAEFEKFYTQFLLENRGRIKIQTINNMMRNSADKLANSSEKVKVSANTDLNTLKKRVDDAEMQLAVAEEQMKTAITSFENAVAKNRPQLQAMISTHISQLANQTSLEGFTPENTLPRGLPRLIPGQHDRILRKLCEECHEELSNRLQESNREWVKNDLLQYLRSFIADRIEDIGQDLLQFYVKIDDVDATLANNANKQQVRRILRDVVAGVCGSVLYSPVAGVLGLAFGRNAMGKFIGGSVATCFLTGVAVVLAAPLATPILVVGHIVSALFAVLSNNPARAEQKAMNDTLANFRTVYNQTSHQDSIEKLLKLCDNCIDEASKQLHNTLQLELDKQRQDIQAILDVAHKDVDEKKRILAQNEKALATLKENTKNGDEIASQYN